MTFHAFLTFLTPFCLFCFYVLFFPFDILLFFAFSKKSIGTLSPHISFKIAPVPLQSVKATKSTKEQEQR